MPRLKMDHLRDGEYPKSTPIIPDKLNPNIKWEPEELKKIPSSPFMYAPDGSVHLDPEVFKMFEARV